MNDYIEKTIVGQQRSAFGATTAMARAFVLLMGLGLAAVLGGCVAQQIPYRFGLSGQGDP